LRELLVSMNKSELLLEVWCPQIGWLCEGIPEGSTRTPDYRINVSETKLYAEVKEVVANDEERKVIRQLSESGCSGAYGEEPGKPLEKDQRKLRANQATCKD
jgi:hypothetical protein